MIDIAQDKLVEGKIYKSFSEMCRELVKINSIAVGTPENPVGSRKKSIERELNRFAEIIYTQKVKGGNRNIEIKKVFSNSKPPISSKPIADYMRPIIKDMVNNEYGNVGFIKFHKELTVDLGYMGEGYIALYKAMYDNECQKKLFNDYKINNDENYAICIIQRLINKIKNHLSTCCKNLNYDSICTDKTEVYQNEDSYKYDEFLTYEDQLLYDDFKKQAKEYLEIEYINCDRVDYRKMPEIANNKYNEYKKSNDSNYKDINLISLWTFIVDGNFQPIPQNINPKKLNQEILGSFLKLINYKALVKYMKTQEYQNNLNSFTNRYAKLCSDKDVRNALMQSGKKREHIAKKTNIDEIDVELDFPFNKINSYVNDIKTIIKMCKI